MCNVDLPYNVEKPAIGQYGEIALEMDVFHHYSDIAVGAVAIVFDRI